jgi:hypothetical protein
MSEYEFIFTTGERMTGEGDDPGSALHDVFRKNGYLPTGFLTSIERIGTGVAEPPFLPPPPEIGSGTDCVAGRPINANRKRK